MQRNDDGVFIPNEDIKKAKKALGNIGLALLGLELIRFIFRPYGRKS
jgi:hypothetical protein